MVLPGARQWGKREDVGLKVQTFSFKIRKFWGANTQHDD